MNKLATIYNELKNAKCPEDFFGDLNLAIGLGKPELSNKYHTLCKVTHEDVYKDKADKEIAHEAFILLHNFYCSALEKLTNKTYGDKVPVKQVVITNKKTSYNIIKSFGLGDVSDLFIAESNGEKVVVKICRDPANNDLLVNEFNNLSKVIEGADEKDAQHFPAILSSFIVTDKGGKKQINVWKYEKDLIPLKKVLEAYPSGIDPRDAAWMFNRILTALVLTHSKGIVHGCLTPDHILLNIESHNAKLFDWGYSVKVGEKIKAISPAYKNHYPEEVFKKKPVDTGLDIYMAAVCLARLLGGTIEDGNVALNKNTPDAIKFLIRSCLIGYAYRSKSALELFEEFNKILKALYGPRKFRAFVMPK